MNSPLSSTDGSGDPSESEALRRRRLVRRGLILCVATAVWNILEGIIAIAAGVAAGSIALFGFGIDSFVETASAAVVGWSFSYEARGRPVEEIERAEKWASRAAGGLLLLLAIYISIDSSALLFGYGSKPKSSLVGIALVSVSLVLMPILGWAKLRTSRELGSRALRADGYESISCAWLSMAVLVGLGLNAAMGWWWADPVAALALVPLIVREGLEGFRGGSCGCEKAAQSR
jgi:divalent metal cation (Fe/Co/Zn/Cd) transporter